MKSQPIPHVKPEDVERIVRRDYPITQFDTVIGMLAEYGTEAWHRESVLVQAAVLKLANGSLDALPRHLDAAKKDYRDVLVVAEVPEYWRAKTRGRKLGGEERDRGHR